MTRITRPHRPLLAVAAPLGILAALLALIEYLKGQGMLPITIAAPSEVAAAFQQNGDDLFYHMGPTVASALAGFASAVIIALSLGTVASSYRRAENAILGFGILVDSIPLIALTPILMIWVGNGLAARVVIATIASLFPLLIGTLQGFKALDRNATDLFHVMSASRWQRLVKLALPTAVPYLFAAFKIAAPLALLGALIAEWVSADRGLGIMMVYALFSFNVPLTWLTIVALCILAVMAYAILAGLERLVVGDSGRDMLIERPQ
jgi:ABC-type nitrate/sulfonate/bicarbonate transport system permease component